MTSQTTSCVTNLPLRSAPWSRTSYLHGDLGAQIGRFIEHYNHHRYHESLENLTPADVYFGRGGEILEERRRIKRQTLEHRRLQHRKIAA